MAKWNKNYNPKLLADQFESAKIISDDGKISFSGFMITESLIILPSMINLNESVPESERKRLISSAIFKAGKRGKITPSSILSSINRLESEYLEMPTRNFKLFTAISISSQCQLPYSRTKHSTIVVNPKLNKNFISERNKQLTQAKKIITAPIPENYSNLTVSINARTEFEATELALDNLDFIRGLWNLAKNKPQTFRMSYGSRKPVNSIILSPVHTLHLVDGTLSTDIYWWEPQFQGAIQPFSDFDKLKKMHSYSKNFRDKLNKLPYKEDIKKAVIRYVRSLDSINWESSFLQLWSVLETLTNTSESPYKVTVRRTSFLYKDRDYAMQILTHLKDYRNRSVHSGSESDEIEALLYQLKLFVEKLIIFLVYSPFKFKSINDAASFLDLPDNKEIIKERIQKLEFAKRFID